MSARFQTADCDCHRRPGRHRPRNQHEGRAGARPSAPFADPFWLAIPRSSPSTHAPAAFGDPIDAVDRIDNAQFADGRLALLACDCPRRTRFRSAATAPRAGALRSRPPAPRSRRRLPARSMPSSPRRRTKRRLRSPASSSTAIRPLSRARPAATVHDVYLMLCFGDTKIVHCHAARQRPPGDVR